MAAVSGIGARTLLPGGAPRQQAVRTPGRQAIGLRRCHLSTGTDQAGDGSFGLPAALVAGATAGPALAVARAARRGRARARGGRRADAARRLPCRCAPRLGNLRVEQARFKDEDGRVAIPRGIAFGGLSKVPRSPNGSTHIGGSAFYEHREVSFVGRPCSLDDLDAHLSRIRSWGFTLLRLLVTWEAVEHAGPGKYDQEYLQYLRAVCVRAHDFGFVVIIDPHQDCWSRWTGGDGAPGWTLEAANLVVGPALHKAGASFLHQENGDPLPSMSWPTNYDRLGCATMMSLFWAGDRVAPGVKPRINSGGAVSLQELLQGSFVQAMAAVARALRGVPAVLGFETPNEPHPGWLGVRSLGSATSGPITTGVSPHEQMKRAKGVWADGRCIWAEAGVWNDATGDLLDADRFRCKDWMGECFEPFVRRYASAIREQLPDSVIVVCPPAFGPESLRPFKGELPTSAVWAPHFYDGVVLVGKLWNPDVGIEEPRPGERLLGGLLPAPPVKPVFGLAERVEAYKRQMSWKGELCGETPVPCLLGEVGVPFDLRGGSGGSRVNLAAAEEAIDAHLRALEELFLPFCWWNYTPENVHERGDGWNGEDLSVFCAEDGGGRGLRALVRPHLVACAGVPVKQSFSLSEGRYRCEFKADGAGKSVFFVPRLHFERGSTEVSATPGASVAWDEALQSLTCSTAGAGRVVLELRRKEVR